MSMFSKLMGKLFGSSESSEEAKAAADEAAEAAADAAATDETGAPAGEEAAAPAPAAEPEPAPAPAPMSAVDVESMLDEMAKANSEDLDWKKSIVDLLKLLDLDSSYGARKEMALELGYSQEDIDSKGSAEMNMWLHKQVMKKIAENGGKVPADLLD